MRQPLIIGIAAIFASVELGLSTGTILGCYLMIQFLAMPATMLTARLAARLEHPEPLQREYVLNFVELAGTPAVVLALPPADELPGNGLIAGQATLAGPKADAIRRFITATRKATEEIIATPEVGLEAAIVRVPELATDRDAQLAVLEATIDTWQNDFTAANGIGAVDPAVWERSIAFMSGLPDSPVAKPVTVAECIDPGFAAQ